MRRARNAAVILILCIIGGYSLMKKTGPTLNMPAGDELRDGLSGNPTRASRPGLNFGQTNDGELRDAVANNAAETGGGSPFGNTDGGVGAPPRGSGNGGFGPADSNVGNNFPPNTPPPGNVSPSAPPTDEQPICPQRSEGCYYYE